MKITDTELIKKRGYKKYSSYQIADLLISFIEENYPKDFRMLNRMYRQKNCSNQLVVYSNDVMKSLYCKEKTCLVCNGIKLAKFLDKYLDEIKKGKALFHMVLSVRNPRLKELKATVDKMYSFYRNSSLKKNKEYRRFNKLIKIIRSFEVTFNLLENTYHPHFHILLSADNEQDAITYGKLIIEYWLKYFSTSADIKGQYLEKQEKDIRENFKYLFKIKDVNKDNIHMAYYLLKVVKGKRLFLAKNIKLDEAKKNELKNKKFNNTENAKIIVTMGYSLEKKTWFIDTTQNSIIPNVY